MTTWPFHPTSSSSLAERARPTQGHPQATPLVYTYRRGPPETTGCYHPSMELPEEGSDSCSGREPAPTTDNQQLPPQG